MRPELLDFARKVAASVNKREIPNWLIDASYPRQADFISDEAKSVVVLGTRRSGKTHGMASRLFRAAKRHPNSIALYIALTRDSAKSIMWPIINELNERHKIGARLTEHDLTAHLLNGSIIKIVGGDMKNFIGRLKGAKYSEAAIDEAQLFRTHLDDLINEVLKPALIDYDGALTLCGTPGAIRDGTFYDITARGLGTYSQHRLTMFENPFLPNATEWLRKHKESMGWKDDNPTLRREYYGEWVDDPSALVYDFDRDRNFKEFKDSMLSSPRYVVGLDIGHNDKTAISVVAYNETSQTAWVVYNDGFSEMTVTEIAEWVRRIVDRYSPLSVQCDTGGLGKTIAAELITRHQLPIVAAEKTDKMSWVALLNDDLRSQRLMIDVKCKGLADQMKTLTKDEHGKEDQRLPNDLCDSMLYAYRRVYSYLSKPKPRELEHGSREWADDQARRIEQQIIESGRVRVEEESEYNNYTF
jgi:hypothetical protein